MPKNAKDAIDFLRPEESAQVLTRLLKCHDGLRDQVNEIARNLLGNFDTVEISEEIVDSIYSIGMEELSSRSGKQFGGYVEPSQAAWELHEEAIKETQDDMVRRFAAGMDSASEKTCQGIILGLHEVEGSNLGLLEWASEFPAEAAAWSLSTLLQLYPQSQREAACKRVLNPLDQLSDEWIEMLNRV